MRDCSDVLEIARDTAVLEPKKHSEKDLLIISEDDNLTLQFSNYKTRRFRDRDELSLKVNLLLS